MNPRSFITLPLVTLTASFASAVPTARHPDPAANFVVQVDHPQLVVHGVECLIMVPDAVMFVG